MLKLKPINFFKNKSEKIEKKSTHAACRLLGGRSICLRAKFLDVRAYMVREKQKKLIGAMLFGGK